MTAIRTSSDPGLARTPLRFSGRPRVGTEFAFPLRRFSRDAALERVLRPLHHGFGPQCWWPARTPFEVIVGAVLTQNTAWGNVELALDALSRTRRDGTRGPSRPPTPRRILAYAEPVLAEAIRSAGTFRAKAKKLRAVSAWYLDAGGLTALRERPLEDIRRELLTVHGVGPETADSILCYAAGRPSPVVDAYARRVLGRHGLLDPSLGYDEIRAWLQARLVRSQPVIEEFHALCVRAGYNHCKPSPRCETCPAPAPPA